MKPGKMNRRQVLTGAAAAGLGTMVPSAGAQQRTEGGAPLFSPRDAGSIHRDMLDLISRTLAGTRLDSIEGLGKIIDLLVQFGVITSREAEILKSLVKTIFDATTIDAMLDGINRFVSALGEKASEVAVAIASIARDSAVYVKALGAKVDRNTAIYFVASDYSGALTGAAVGAKLGGWKVALLMALGGGIADSVLTLFGGRR